MSKKKKAGGRSQALENEKRTKRHKRNGRKKGWKPIEWVILLAAICVFLVSGYKLAGIFLEYKAGVDAYDSLQERYVIQGAAPERKEEETQEAVDDLEAFPDIDVNYKALKEINEDFLGWLVIPVLELEYPVVQGEDNDYYMYRTFEREDNRSGSIFMDAWASPDLTDYNTFIFGHNMRNLSMFCKLKLLSRDEELCAENPYFYLYTEDNIYQYLIVSYYVTRDGSSTYYIPVDEEDYETYKKMVLRSTPYECPMEIPEDSPMITLSTCYGAAGGTQRFVVHGILNRMVQTPQYSDTAGIGGE